MRVYVYAGDEAGCGTYRMILPSRVLAAQGHDVRVVLPKQRNLPRYRIGGLHHSDGRLVGVEIPEDVDVIVLQRVTYRMLAQSIPMIRARGVAVVVDIDDDLDYVHPSNPAFLMMHPKTPGDHASKWAHHACEAATMVTVSADALLPRYAPHGRGRVLYNCVPEAYLNIPRRDSPTIGWAGSLHSHPDDLTQVGPSIARLAREGNQFRIVGPPTGIRAALGLDREAHGTGVVSMADWPAEVAKLGIGIAPLADTRFNAAKSYLKPIEYAACGVPVVASPRAEYTRLHRQGVGMLAARPKDWYSALKKLTADAGLREDMSARGREVASQLTVEANAWRWWEAWTEAHQLQRQAAVAVGVGVAG